MLTGTPNRTTLAAEVGKLIKAFRKLDVRCKFFSVEKLLTKSEAAYEGCIKKLEQLLKPKWLQGCECDVFRNALLQDGTQLPV